MNRLTYETRLGGMTMGPASRLPSAVLDRDRQDGNANWHTTRFRPRSTPAEVRRLPIDPQDNECNPVAPRLGDDDPDRAWRSPTRSTTRRRPPDRDADQPDVFVAALR
jgi:hypothetical protein